MKPRRCSPGVSFSKRQKTEKPQVCLPAPVLEQAWEACLFRSSLKASLLWVPGSGWQSCEGTCSCSNLETPSMGQPGEGKGLPDGRAFSQGTCRQERHLRFLWLAGLMSTCRTTKKLLCILTFNPRCLRQSSESWQALQFNWSFLIGRVHGVSGN